MELSFVWTYKLKTYGGVEKKIGKKKDKGKGCMEYLSQGIKFNDESKMKRSKEDVFVYYVEIPNEDEKE